MNVQHLASRRTLRGSVTAVVVASTLMLVACSNDASKTDSASSVAAASSSESQATSTSAADASADSAATDAVNQKLVANLKADAEQILDATNAFLEKEDVSETSKGLASDLQKLLDSQVSTLDSVQGGESLVDSEEVSRVKESDGASADIAYLTLLENNLGRLADAWQGLKTSSDQDIAKAANEFADQLTEMKARVDKRMQF